MRYLYTICIIFWNIYLFQPLSLQMSPDMMTLIKKIMERKTPTISLEVSVTIVLLT